MKLIPRAYVKYLSLGVAKRHLAKEVPEIN